MHILDVLAVKEVVAQQSELRRQICELLMHDCNQTEVAEQLGLHHSTVSRHVAAIREAFIQAGFGSWRWRGRPCSDAPEAVGEKEQEKNERYKRFRHKGLRRWRRRPAPIS